MHQLLLILPVLLPAMFWAAYHYYKDRHLPEPVGKLLVTLVLGMLAAALSFAAYLALGLVGLRYDAYALADADSSALLAYAILAIGPIEELCKMLPFVLLVRRFRAFEEPLDGITYASFIALGYAALENWQYLEYLSMRLRRYPQRPQLDPLDLAAGAHAQDARACVSGPVTIIRVVRIRMLNDWFLERQFEQCPGFVHEFAASPLNLSEFQ